MITTSDIADILFEACASFGIEDMYRKGFIPEGAVSSERVVILPKNQTTATYWKKGFVEINLCVPNITEGVADIARLQELERQAMDVLDGRTGEYDSSHYRFGVESIEGVLRDDDTKCHFVNVRILFEVLNC